MEEKTLQVAIRPQLFERVAHRRMVTVRSRPGSVFAVVGTDTMSRFNSAFALRGGNPNPLTTFETVWPSGIVREQNTLLACRSCNCTGPPLGAVPTIAKISRAATVASTTRVGAALVCIARYPST